MDDAGGKALCQAWELLNIVRSFESDIDMFEKVAKAASKTNELRLSQAANGGGGGSGAVCNVGITGAAGAGGAPGVIGFACSGFPAGRGCGWRCMA